MKNIFKNITIILLILNSFSLTAQSSPPVLLDTPTLGAVTQPNCSSDKGSFTITNYNAYYSYSANPSTGVSFTGPTVTAPAGTYTIKAVYKGDSSSPSASIKINPVPSICKLSNENYVQNIIPTIETTDVDVLAENQREESVTYIDGLARPMQSIDIRAGGNGEDIITHAAYDNFGRQEKEYLPYTETSDNGFFRTGDIALATKNFYNTAKYENTINPYSQKEFEASSLNRVLKQAAPGTDWALGAGHEIRLDYQINTAADTVRRFGVSFIAGNKENPYLKDNGIYEPSQLYKTITKDENWQTDQVNPDDHTTQEFKDKKDRVVLKRTFDANKWHDTYYIYDDYGNLTFVISPKASNLITSSSISVLADETSTAKINSTNSPLHITASNSIRLLDGFHAQTGSTFSAVIVNSGQNILNDLCYQYRYDSKNRLIEKKLPGKGWEYIVYDKLDRPVLTQDANLKANNKWLFTKYDAFGRNAYTGIYTNNAVRSSLQNDFDSQNNVSTKLYESKVVSGTGYLNSYYTNDNFPNSAIELYTINYYDNYSFDKDNLVLPQTAGGGNIINYDNAGDTQKLTKSLPTGTKVRVLESTNWITTVIGYDAKRRSVYSAKKNNFLSTVDIIESTLDFVGKTNKTITTHKGALSVVIEDLFTYDTAGRLKKQTRELNNSDIIEIINENTYDELGQLTSKKVGGKTTQGLQKVDYTYNIRGWLKSINDPNNLNQDDLFGFGLNYNTIVNPLSNINKPLYNGNISSISWKTNSPNAVLKQYKYVYDALDRFTTSQYAENNVFQSKFSEVISEYDLNGNMMNLYRNMQNPNDANSGTSIDYLVYTYDNGNRLMKVDDELKDFTFGYEGFKDGTNTDDDYSYDANGNMTSDKNKGIIAITYNHLNLPVTITFATGTINYFYDVTGVKQRKIVNPGVTTDYAGGFQYENNVLKFFPQPEGYVEYNSGIFSYIYQYKDNLRNIRLSYKDVSTTTTPSLQVIEENNYYPFGLKHKDGNNMVSSTNPALKYKYNGKELQDENIGNNIQLNLYDYGARNYDPALGRWMNIDPLAEKFQNLSPYTYALNNPLRFIDPDGKAPEDIILWGWDPALNKYRQTLVMKSNIYNINYYSKNIFAPMAPASRAPIGPTYIYGLDAWATLAGKPDAVRFNISAQLHAGGVNVGGTLGVVAPLKGPDKGGLFFYGPSNEKGFDIGFEKASYSLEIDGALSASLIYKTDNNFKKFDRTTFEGLEASVGGNYGIFNASTFTASDKSYFGFSFGFGKSMGIFNGDKRGDMAFGLSGAKLIDYLTINPER